VQERYTRTSRLGHGRENWNKVGVYKTRRAKSGIDCRAKKEKMNIEDKLKQLRIQWKNEPQNRWKIEQQVKVLKLGSRYPEKIVVKKPESFADTVKKELS